MTSVAMLGHYIRVGNTSFGLKTSTIAAFAAIHWTNHTNHISNGIFRNATIPNGIRGILPLANYLLLTLMRINVLTSKN